MKTFVFVLSLQPAKISHKLRTFLLQTGLTYRCIFLLLNHYKFVHVLLSSQIQILSLIVE